MNDITHDDWCEIDGCSGAAECQADTEAYWAGVTASDRTTLED